MTQSVSRVEAESGVTLKPKPVCVYVCVYVCVQIHDSECITS